MAAPATRDEQQALVALRAERLLRTVARRTNRLIPASPVRLDVEDGAVEARLREVLGPMGARFATSASEGIDEDQVLLISDSSGSDARGSSAAERIARAARFMPATMWLAAELAQNGTVAGKRILLSLVLEPKTAALALALRDSGAMVAVFGAVAETDTEVVSVLADSGCAVFAPLEATVRDALAADAANAAAALDWGPELLVDDGAHLVRLAHTERGDALARSGGTLAGASEETTSGVRPLAEMEAERVLGIPVIAANDARTKTGFDNLIGTGQSCVFAIADLLDAPELERFGPRGVLGTRWVVIGYGPVGQGVARFAAALGARITIVERDAVLALAAMHDGFEALPLCEAIRGADVVVSATGVWHTLDSKAVAALDPGTAIAVAGGIDDEIALDELLAAGWQHRRIARAVDEWVPPGYAGEHPGVLVLAEGGGVNYTAGEGNPIEVMDLSFATQLVALERLAANPLEPGVHRFNADDEQRVAAMALSARGGGVDPRSQENTAHRPGGAAQHWREHRYRNRA